MFVGSIRRVGTILRDWQKTTAGSAGRDNKKTGYGFLLRQMGQGYGRQRELLRVIAELPNCDGEFTVQEITEHPSNQEPDKSLVAVM